MYWRRKDSLSELSPAGRAYHGSSEFSDTRDMEAELGDCLSRMLGMRLGGNFCSVRLIVWGDFRGLIPRVEDPYTPSSLVTSLYLSFSLKGGDSSKAFPDFFYLCGGDECT